MPAPSSVIRSFSGVALALALSRPTSAQDAAPLERTRPSRVLISLSHLEIEGTFSAVDLGEHELVVRVDLPLSTELGTTLEGLDIDRDGPERSELHSAVLVEGTPFDDSDFAAIPVAGEARFDDPESVASQTVTASLAASKTNFTLD
jgi:hypothetical protein